MNAGRKYLSSNELTGKVFLTSGLGGMSGAQAKASVIAGCIGVIAEVDALKLGHVYYFLWFTFSFWLSRQRKCPLFVCCLFQVNADALMKRYNQGWLMEWTDDLDACIDRIR